jgi:hypothetical protein
LEGGEQDRVVRRAGVGQKFGGAGPQRGEVVMEVGVGGGGQGGRREITLPLGVDGAPGQAAPVPFGGTENLPSVQLVQGGGVQGAGHWGVVEGAGGCGEGGSGAQVLPQPGVQAGVVARVEAAAARAGIEASVAVLGPPGAQGVPGQLAEVEAGGPLAATGLVQHHQGVHTSVQQGVGERGEHGQRPQVGLEQSVTDDEVGALQGCHRVHSSQWPVDQLIAHRRQTTLIGPGPDDADPFQLPAFRSLGELMPADPAALGDIGVDERHQPAHRAGCAATRFALGHGRYRSGQH